MTKSHSNEDAHNHVYMTIDDVVGYLRVKSRSTIYRWMKTGDFPKPKNLEGLRRWDMSEIAEWAVTRNSK